MVFFLEFNYCDYNDIYLFIWLIDLLYKGLNFKEVCEGLKKHGNTITMGNEFKPDSFF